MVDVGDWVGSLCLFRRYGEARQTLTSLFYFKTSVLCNFAAISLVILVNWNHNSFTGAELRRWKDQIRHFVRGIYFCSADRSGHLRQPSRPAELRGMSRAAEGG